MDLRFSKSVRSVVLLEKGPAGEVTPTVLHTKKRKSKKGSRMLNPVEKLARKLARANATFAESYQTEHDKSNDKATDGWLIDLGKNTFVAARKAGKSLYKK